ncbi:MAG TPA: FAD-dependent oxidoreductase [Anaeromyxobacteraceae bacterium]|nr:FAD-dependent oxidoreductase [Anaeromyxobacteraceae bacterium]
MGKTLVCACEDVRLEEVRRAFEAGHRDLESVKRYTGFGTGPCQGKSCLALVARELLRLGATPGEVVPFTARPPREPTALGALAAIDPAELPIGREGVPPETPPPRPGPEALAPLPARADVVIIGGGIQGLSLAWELARRGTTDVLVLEQAYLNYGASGRNGGGVRAQWTTPTMIRLAKRSLELCARFAVDLGVNVWFRPSGYLFLAPAEQVRRLEANALVHRREGLRTRVLTPQQALEVVPALDPTRFAAASYNPDDGVVFPWPFLWGYAAGAEAMGVKVRTFTRVTGLRAAGARLTHVETDRGPVECRLVVNAAGAWSKGIAALAGVAVPNRPTRHEILVTEPLAPFLDPLVSLLGHGLYFSQSQRGELVGGAGDPDEPEGVVMGSTLRFLARFARAATEVLPRLAGVKVVRQWAGCYDVTPDNNPILGPAGFENFQQLHGFVGHGFMMAPAVAEQAADVLTGRARHELFERYTLDRFARGDVAREDFVIG